MEYYYVVRSLNRSDTPRHLLFVVSVVVSSDSSFRNQPWSVPYGVRSTEYGINGDYRTLDPYSVPFI